MEEPTKQKGSKENDANEEGELESIEHGQFLVNSGVYLKKLLQVS